MNRNNVFLFVVLVAVCSLSGCSGPKGGGCVINCGGGGTGTLVLTVTSSPATSLSTISVLSASVGITGITVTNSSSTSIPITLTPTVFPVDFGRLQTDSAYLGSLSLTSASYTSATITFAAPVLTIFNNTGATINGTCLASTVCNITLTAGSAQISGAPLFIVSSSQPVGRSFHFNLGSALTLSNGTLAINFSATNVATSAALPRTGTPSGDFDLIEDFVGQVTAVSSSSLTVTAASGISHAFTLPTTPAIFDPQGLCGATASITCLVANKTLVSVDASVTTAGVLTLISADVLDITPKDEVEGVLFFSNPVGPYGLVVTNKFVSSGNATLAAANVGDVFTVTLSNPSFIVDTNEFTGNASAPSSIFTSAFADSSGFISGQTIMVHATSATGTHAQDNEALTTDQVRLRSTRTFGTVTSISGQTFDIGSFPAIVGLQGTPIVNTIQGVTNFDGVANIGGVSAGNIVSLRALLIKASPNFYAAKVRL